MGLLSKLAKSDQSRGVAVRSPTTGLAEQVEQQPERHANPVAPADRPPPFQLPPPIPCLICECPGIWITTYDLAEIGTSNQITFRCCDCEPPPSRSLIGARWLIVGADPCNRRWELFTRGHNGRARADHNALADAAGGGEAGESGEDLPIDERRAAALGLAIATRLAAADLIYQSTRCLAGNGFPAIAVCQPPPQILVDGRSMRLF